MSRGYVKSRIEQMTRDNSLSPPEENGVDRRHNISPVEEQEIVPNLVQRRVQAAEKQQSAKDACQFSPVKRPSMPCLSPKVSSVWRKSSCPGNNWEQRTPPHIGSPKSRNRTYASFPSENGTGVSSSDSTAHKPASVNGGNGYPTIPTKPTSLSVRGPRKSSLSPSTSSSTSPSSIPSQHSPPAVDDPGPIYAQVQKNRTNRLNGTAGDQPNQTSEEPADNASSGGVVLRDNSSTRERRESEQYRASVFSTIYDNAPSLTAAELFDSSWSDYDSDKGFSDEGEGGDGDKEDHIDGTEEQKDKEIKESKAEGSSEDKRFRIARELLQTEQDYVDKLSLLHVVFRNQLEEENSRQQFFAASILNQIFSNTKMIYLFHHDFLLPQLQDRMNNWDDDPRIGDLMKKNAPFLKMYSEYIRNFSQSMKLLEEWSEKSPRFSSIIEEIQKLPECGSLSLQHHMLGPIQRVPRYELLLKDYVKHLPADSPDMKDASDALNLVTIAACHSNECMKKIETFRKLLDIYHSLRGVAVDFISPTREFIMQGPITKISARSGEKQLRYIFLFNDMILICSSYLLGTYNVRCQMQVENMEVKQGKNMNIPNTFVVHSKQKAVEFLDIESSGGTESPEWEQRIRDVIQSYKARKISIKHDDRDFDVLENTVPDSCLGKTAPRWIPDDAASMCMLCGTSFTMMRRRHHCRSCGKLVCRSCCNKAPLEYMNGKIERVCTYCYDIIVNKVYESTSDSSTPNSPKKKKAPKVRASDRGLVASYLLCSEDKGKTWQRLWVTAHSDFVLYTFKAHEDVSAISKLPLPGYAVETRQENDLYFCLKHKNKCVMYLADKKKKKNRWVTILSKLVKVEFPQDSDRHSLHSDSSHNSSCSNAATTADADQNGVDGDTDGAGNSDDKADAKSQYDNVDA